MRGRMNSFSVGCVMILANLCAVADTIELVSGEERLLSEPLASADELRVVVVTSADDPSAYYRTDIDTVVLRDAKLADWDFHSAFIHSSYGTKEGYGEKDRTVSPMFVNRTDTSLTAQFQYYPGDMWPRNRCVKLEMKEKDGNLVVRVLYARYINVWCPSNTGIDFDSTEYETLSPALALGDDQGGVGLRSLVLKKMAKDSAKVVIEDPAILPAAISVDAATVSVVGEAAHAFASAMSGNGTFSFGPYQPRVEDRVEKAYSGNVLSTDTVLFSDRDCRMGLLTGVEDVYRRKGEGEDASDILAEVHFLRIEDSKASFQVQSRLDGVDHTRCAFVEVVQDGELFKAKIVDAYYGWHVPLGTDFSDPALLTDPELQAKYVVEKQDVAWAANPNNPNAEGVIRMTLVFSNVRIEANLALPSLADFTGDVEVKEGVTVRANDDGLLPSGGVALAGGTLNVLAACDCGSLTLADNSTLALGENASIRFCDSSDCSWAQERTLAVVGSFVEGSSVRFGEDKGGLTKIQSSAIRFNGNDARLDAEGYLTFLKNGLVIFVR